jgi:hypothetical protein
MDLRSVPFIFPFYIPLEREIIDIVEYHTSASYLDVLWNMHTVGKLTTQLYHNLDDFIFDIVHFPYTCNNIPISPAYGACISQLIRNAKTSCIHHNFFARGSLMTKILMLQGFLLSLLMSAFRKWNVRYNDLTYNYNLSLSNMLSDKNFHCTC